MGKRRDFMRHVKLKRKSLKSRQEKGRACVTAMIDETGDPGSRAHGKQYVLGATVIETHKIETFSGITKKRWEGKELKFREQKKLRNEILNEVSELEPRLYAVTATKPKFRNWNKKEQRNVHRNALSKLTTEITVEEKATSIHMIIDENTKAKEKTVNDIVSRAGGESKKKVTAEVKRSKDSYPLQTNDFCVGAMGKRFNRNDTQYSDQLPGIRRCRMIVGKTRPWRGREK